MERYILYPCLALALTANLTFAETLPEFRAPCRKATHIAVVQTMSAQEGKFVVLDVWKGDLEQQASLVIPDMSELAKGKMILFLCQEKSVEHNSIIWKPAGFDFRTSVVWIKDGEVTSVQQPCNPGPAYVTTMPWAKNVEDLAGLVKFHVLGDRLLSQAKASEDSDERIRILTQILDEHCDRKDDALEALGQCGAKALPVIREFMNGRPISLQRERAIPALVAAGGESVLPELSAKLNGELAYWKHVAPTLKNGWWFNTNGEPCIRHHRVEQLAAVFTTHPYPDTKPTLVALRDLFRSSPALDDDDRIGRVSDHLDRALERLISPSRDERSRAPGATKREKSNRQLDPSRLLAPRPAERI